MDLAFLLDVDNTLIDNDRVKDDLRARIEQLVGEERARVFWSVYEDVRRERDYVDFPRTLERFRGTWPDEAGFPAVAALVLCYPYETALFPRALEAVRHLASMGGVAILSDGDPVFQPAKIARSGLADAVGGRVFVYAHKEEHLGEVGRRVPAARYVLLDDKPRVLAAVKERLGDRVVTLHVCQGSYAHLDEHDAYPAPDLEVGTIADVVGLRARDFLPS